VTTTHTIAKRVSRSTTRNHCQPMKWHESGLAPGKAADLIALSDNLFELPAEQIKDCRVELTVVDGQICHQLW
jgi:predicted amidohydrolase YtcJ